jgi:hypothetical protein
LKTEQLLWQKSTGWPANPVSLNGSANLVLAFGGIDIIGKPEIYNELKSRYNHAQIVLTSTAGEIHGDVVMDNSVSVTACRFEQTELDVHEFDISQYASSNECGLAIANKMGKPKLKHLLIFCDGTAVNGDDLLIGINTHMPENVIVTGGLAADAGRFSETLVGLNRIPEKNKIVCIGFYGDKLKVCHGSQGGWDAFGPKRKITKSRRNVLYEIDGENALELYKKYLGHRAAELPGAALLFPLCLYTKSGEKLVRTILNIDEENGTMHFAGNIPKGSEVQFMMANLDRIVSGAEEAAEYSHKMSPIIEPDLVLMISCVGRKIILDQRVDEEIETVCNVFGKNAAYTGFYSNGEFSPNRNEVACSLHNQTMTITTYTEG